MSEFLVEGMPISLEVAMPSMTVAVFPIAKVKEVSAPEEAVETVRAITYPTLWGK